ncbi:lytic transglycosylase domain-containing protein [Ureibacillus thermophilus]|uniref:Lytic transglycosylase domain-containing protein n=1 Tax=Ureibacillus thermophilus TaxID=367743 RepID=A0A4P6UTU1_9BACL|nr:lytic transglycosylase domain-containing protein [Ureibacillus thermophilus]QBK26187.1 lytic transglycosylase domain-containing protein [Ureibacillus thermophilus]
MAKKKKAKKPFISAGMKLFLIILLIPASIVIYTFVFFAWADLKAIVLPEELSVIEEIQEGEGFDLTIPEEYIPIYIAAGKKYNVPWTLLAAHHRVETRFSTMKTLISPVGAEGHMQFMPCTFVGWDHPSCEGLGKGNIPESEKTDPKVIAKYGGYGVDANGDGIADPFDIEDAIYSAANFLSKAGVREGKIEKAIFQYNHSQEYVKKIMYYYEQYERIGPILEKEALAAAADS